MSQERKVCHDIRNKEDDVNDAIDDKREGLEGQVCKYNKDQGRDTKPLLKMTIL
jgi:hypothetical protein